MTNTSKYNSRLLRDPRPSASRAEVFGIVNPYWKVYHTTRKADRKRQAASDKRQARKHSLE
jgi:hypothetical protein